MLVFLVALLMTGALAFTASSLYSHNEKRLLDLRAREIGSVLSAVIPSIQTPLASAAALADATGGNAQKFKALVKPYVGTGGGPATLFVSASLWRLGASQPVPVAVVGAAPALASLPAYASGFLAQTPRAATLNVTHLLTSPQLRLGYAFSTPGDKSGYVAYGEGALPSDRRSRLQSNSAFSDLNYAVYLGRGQRPQDLLITSLNRLPVKGRQASTEVPFGNAVFTLVVTPRGSLGGGFFHSLPWIIAVAGTLLALAAAALTDRLVRRRKEAERLATRLDRVAEENRRLYAEQRGIAQTLQHALLPERLPDLGRLQASVRYIPGVAGIEVGGDWYDVAALDERRVFIAVGDVSGRGLRAATTMASLRYASLAYAVQGDPPATVLRKLSGLASVEERGDFASMLCGVIDLDRQQMTLASAGHLAPLLMNGSGAQFVPIRVGAPIGVRAPRPYAEVEVPIPPGATLIAFTDGLIERRGESLDVGLQRLRDAATSRPDALDDLLRRIADELTHDGGEDDTAILGIRWPS